MTVSEAMKKMIVESDGSLRDIEHLIKVWTYAKTIGELEGLDERTQDILEYAAIVHDIACPALRAEYGSSPGDKQQELGGPMARRFYEELGLAEDMIERVVFLVEHHHTYDAVDGPDYQILLEADFLVNAGASEKYRQSIRMFRDDIFKTKTGIALLESIYMGGRA